MKTTSNIIEQLFHEGTVFVCAHRVTFFYRIPSVVSTDIKNRLTEAAEKRAKEQIVEGCLQGELNYENDEIQARGWWMIEN